jgi:hypothetical protein
MIRMIRQAQVLFIVFILLINGFAVAAIRPAELSCQDLFLDPILSTTEKLNFIDEGIRSESRLAFENYNILPQDPRGQKQLRRYLRKLDFEKIRSNQILKIAQIISDRHAPLFGQIKLVMQRRFGEAKANIVLNRLANQLAFMSLYQAFEKGGRIQDLGLLTRYKVLVRQHFPVVHTLGATAFSIYSVYTGITAGNFRGLDLPQLQLLKYKDLPAQLQDQILDGIYKSIPDVIAKTGRRASIETVYDMTYRTFYMGLTVVTIAMIANMISEKMFGYRPNDVFDDIFFRDALESAAVDSIITGLSETGVNFDETYVRQQVHEMSLKNLKAQTQN